MSAPEHMSLVAEWRTHVSVRGSLEVYIDLATGEGLLLACCHHGTEIAAVVTDGFEAKPNCAWQGSLADRDSDWRDRLSALVCDHLTQLRP